MEAGRQVLHPCRAVFVPRQTWEKRCTKVEMQEDTADRAQGSGSEVVGHTREKQLQEQQSVLSPAAGQVRSARRGGCNNLWGKSWPTPAALTRCGSSW